MKDHYVWLVWASAFLLPWVALYWRYPAHRRTMWWTSVLTAPFGLTEPLFVPEYWDPPSLFHLAQRTGFDIESLIFCFGIGGVGVVLYNVLTKHTSVAVDHHERHTARHRYHRLALFAPIPTFLVLILLPWNAIYPGIAALVAGALAAAWCRPDLLRKTWIGGLLFLGYYLVFLVGLELTAPGYIERVWNLDALSGVVLYRIPLEELLFAGAFGVYWSGVYEHVTWRRLSPV